MDGKVFTKTNADIIADLEYNGYVASKSDWQIKKYAYKLKQIVSILTGIPIEDLEKQEVKNSKLGEEWIRYGYANGFCQINGNTIMNNVICSKEKYEEERNINWQTAYKHEYTIRDLLQLIGTEAMRNVIHHDIWVNALFADYYCQEQKCKNSGNKCALSEDEYTCENEKYPNWVITDVIFPNEFKAIKDKGGIVIRLNRNLVLDGNNQPIDKNKSYAYKDLNIAKANHPSETVLDNHSFDYIINNDGTIEELVEKVKEILIKEKII